MSPLPFIAGDANHEACAKLVEHHIDKKPPPKRQRHDQKPVLTVRHIRPESRPVHIPEPSWQPQSVPSQPTRRPGPHSKTQLGATPAQLLRSYVPVSAKAQCDAARDYMAEQAMQKMGRRVRRSLNRSTFHLDSRRASSGGYPAGCRTPRSNNVQVSTPAQLPLNNARRVGSLPHALIMLITAGLL